MEDIFVLWNIGTDESPIFVWWNDEISEIEHPSKYRMVVSPGLNHVRRGWFTACQFQIEFLSVEGNTKFLRHHQSESGGNAVVTR